MHPSPHAELVYRAIFQQTFGFFVVMRPDGTVVECNDASLATTGFTVEEVTGRPLWETGWWSPDASLAQELKVDVLAAAQTKTTRRETAYYTRDGRVRYIDRTIAPILDDAGAITLLLVEGRDVTDRHHAEDARRDAEQVLADHAEALARSNTELEQFAYVASHDLQEPLRMVAGFIQLLQLRYTGKLDADAERWMGRVVDGAKRMQRLINDLLAYSRLSRRDAAKSEVQLKDVLAEVRRQLATDLAAAGGALEVADLPTLRGDPDQLVQLFKNLVGNALKFARPDVKPVVVVTAERAPGLTTVRVRDNGIGIEPQYFDRIFVIFQRLHGPETYEGTGMGLAICKKIMERHGGMIEVESAPGAGTTFTLRFPKESGR